MSGSAVRALRRHRLGRKLIGGLNTLGSMGTALLLSRRSPRVVDGHVMYLAAKSGPSISFARSLLAGTYESETRALLEKMVQPGMTVLDVGAHAGYYTLLFARWVGPEGTVYAFEPSPENYKLLQENVAANKYQNVRTIPKAVSNRTGAANLFLSRQGNDRHSIFSNPRSVTREVPRSVEALRMDDFLAAEGWPEVGLVKMDIEGAEPLAFEGMQLLIGRSRRLGLAVELAPEALEVGGNSAGGFLQQIGALGLAVSSIHEGGALKPWHPGDFERLAGEAKALGMVNLYCEKK